jgi:hypothetical protein
MPGASPSLISKQWLKKNIQIGPLGSEYPDVMYGMEGDTPSYLGLIPVSMRYSVHRSALTGKNGLNNPERPDFGGWAGRYKKIFDLEAEHYHDTCDTVVSLADGSTQCSVGASIWRWRDAVQNDFAARIQCVISAYHHTTPDTPRWTVEESQSKLQLPPKVIVDGDETQAFVYRTVKPSEILEIDASASYAPDGSDMSFKWFQYKEIDSVMPTVCHSYKLSERRR